MPFSCSSCGTELFGTSWVEERGGYVCGRCGSFTHPYERENKMLAEDATSVFGGGQDVVVRVYPGRTQADAAALYQRDAELAAGFGYAPTGQSWSEGRPGVGRVVMLGFYSMFFKPKGFLTVTYGRSRQTETPEVERGPCPRCGESIPLAAIVCRFCGLDVEKYDEGLLQADDGTEADHGGASG